jgi:hypothetical protein
MWFVGFLVWTAEILFSSQVCSFISSGDEDGDGDVPQNGMFWQAILACQTYYIMEQRRYQ